MFQHEYQIAIQAAQKAGGIIQKYYHADYTIEKKSPDQPVTIADREANEAIKQTLLTAFPADGWLSEETSDTKERLQKNRVWIVDPLDGTKEFINKIPEFAVSIALVVDQKPVVGVVYNPASGELFSVCKQGGAYLNKQKILVSQTRSLKQAIILASRSELSRNEWDPYQGCFHIKPSGGMAYKMSVVACGLADASFSLQPKTEWDFAAATLLIEEAGGRVCQLNGDPFLFNQTNPRVPGLVYGNPQILQILFTQFESDFLKAYSKQF